MSEPYKCVIVPNTKTYKMVSRKWRIRIVDGKAELDYPPRVKAPARKRRKR